MINNSFTYDYAVSKCRNRVQKEEHLHSLSPLLENKVHLIHSFKYCIIRTFISSFEVCVHARLHLIFFLEKSNGQPRMTKSSKIVLDIVFFLSLIRGDKAYMLILRQFWEGWI